MTRAALVVLAAGAILGAFRVAPVTRLLPPCPVAALTGLHCPGCGSGRALAALARGDVAAAFRFNPLLAFVIPCCAWLAVGEARARRRGVPFVVPRWVVRTILAVIFLFAVARNLEGFGFLGP